MKTLFIALLALAPAARAATAYEALRIVGKSRSEATIDRTTEVRGYKGAPQPVLWRIVTEDKDAKGGVREFDVKGAKLGAEHTPADATPGIPLNIGALNLDSDGAHTIAEREAKKAAFGYDHVNYTLRAADKAGAPVWEIRLVDERYGATATVTIAADTGKLLTAQGFGKARATDVAEKKRGEEGEPIASAEDELPPVPDEARRRQPDQREVRDENGEIDKPGTKLSRFFDRINEKATRRANIVGNKVSEKAESFGDRIRRTFSGESKPRTAAPPPAPAPRTYRDKNGTEFVRPRD